MRPWKLEARSQSTLSSLVATDRVTLYWLSLLENMLPMAQLHEMLL